MGILTKPTTDFIDNRAGIALPATVFGMVIIGVLGAGMWTMTDLESAAHRNRVDSAKALQVAEAGAAHALAILRTQLRDTSYTRLLRGFNNSGPNSDDGLLDFYPGLGDSIDIPATGRSITGGTYFVKIVDDAQETNVDTLSDANNKVTVRCIGVTPTGARAVLEFKITHTQQLPAVAVDGPLTISGNPTIAGSCGDVHANGNVTATGSATVNAKASSSGVGVGLVENAAGASVPVQSLAPTMDIPAQTYGEYCPASGDYVLRADGFILRRSDNTLHDARSTGRFGWKRSSSAPVVWSSDSDGMSSGTFCVEGNVTLSHNPGGPQNPLPMSIIAQGSVEISGNPYLAPDEASGATLVAGGDLKINGNPAAGAYNFQGTMYAGSNCEVSGNPTIFGNLECKSGPLPAGANDIISENKISGNAHFTYSCDPNNPLYRRRIISWYQRIGA
jgi:hypothetical protein